MQLKQGTLWRDLVQKTEYALSIGAQQPIPTEYEFVQDSGMRFFVRVLTTLALKDEERKKQEIESSSSERNVNPFLPYDRDLFVADISETHVALLNKFNVVENHLLIVTRDYDDQEDLLTLKDFEALWLCMAEYNGLGFYNGGVEAGASQPHKHLQMVPLPLAPEGPSVPIEFLLANARFEAGFGTIPEFPFKHTFVNLENDIIKFPMEAALKTFELYSDMLLRVGLEPIRVGNTQRQSAPYCFIVTKEWMLLVPRTMEFFDSVSINSLGFAGALLVRNKNQLEMLKKCGPMTVLKSVAMSV